MPTYPLATLAPTIDSSGISIPSYNDIYQSLIADFKNIYGADIYIAPDSQDGQWLAILASAFNNSNQAMVAVFQSFSPTYAQGIGLSSVVKINGIMRGVATNSTAVGNVIGVAGTIITAGIVQDINGNLWNLPATVTIPIGGSISVTVTAQQVGNIIAPIGTINKIANPQLGWQSFSNTSDAIAGAPVESDATLRGRQTISAALPALTVLDAILAAVGNVTGVTRFTALENDTATTDANGIPAHSIAVVVLGGSVLDVATAISRKAPGVQTYGTTSQTVTDIYGLPTVINFFQLTQTNVYFAITIKALTGYVSTTGTALVNALVNFVNSLAIGEDVYQSQAQAAASLINQQIGQTYYIVSLFLGTSPSPGGSSNIVIPFNAAAICATANVILTVT